MKLTWAIKKQLTNTATAIDKHSCKFKRAFATYIKHVGPLLITARDIFRGNPLEFNAWCLGSIGYTKASALRFIQIYSTFKADFDLIAELGHSKLCALVKLTNPINYIKNT